MAITKVMVAGGGTLGSQIAWQTSFKGFEVVIEPLSGLPGGNSVEELEGAD